MRKFLVVLLVLALISGIFAGCSNDSANTTDDSEVTEAPTEDKVQVALAADTGGINDKAINEATHTGMTKASEELGVDYKVLEAKSPDDYEANLEALVSDGSTLVVGIGGNMASAVESVAARFPDIHFVILDATSKMDNVTGIVFKEHEGSFLAGVVAGMMTKTNKVGFLGGMDIEVINRFEAGFAAGVMCVNEEAGMYLIGENGAPGTAVKFAESFSDSNKGYELSTALYADGCDVIYHAAGPVGLGLFMATFDASENGEKVWAIGVDQDQAAVLPEYADYILTSMVKKTGVAAYDIIQVHLDGTFNGENLTLGVGEGAVGLAETTNVNTPEDVLAVVEKAVEMIKSGELVVPSNREELAQFEPVSLN